MVRSEALRYFSIFIGWVYFSAWTASFIPQCVLNYKRKSVVGLSFEYITYNFTGFLFYLTYSTVNYVVQHKLDLDKTVQINDICFGVFAWVMTVFTMLQCVIYEKGEQKVNKKHLALNALLWVIFITHAILSISGVLPWYRSDDSSGWNTMEYLGVVKAFITFIKCTPQVYLNWKRQSTVGWSISNILLDLTGGVLSFSQNAIDAYNEKNVHILYGNFAKLLLSCVSVLMDIIFLMQHYVFFTDRDEPLLEGLITDDEEEYGSLMDESTRRTSLNSVVS